MRQWGQVPFRLLPRPSMLTLLDQRAANIGLVGQDTSPVAAFPQQNVGLDLFDREILMFKRTRKREFKGYGRDVVVDSHTGVRKVRLVSLSCERPRPDRCADGFPRPGAIAESADTVNHRPVGVEQAAKAVGVVGPHCLCEFLFRLKRSLLGGAVAGPPNCGLAGRD